MQLMTVALCKTHRTKGFGSSFGQWPGGLAVQLVQHIGLHASGIILGALIGAWIWFGLPVGFYGVTHFFSF